MNIHHGDLPDSGAWMTPPRRGAKRPTLRQSLGMALGGIVAAILGFLSVKHFLEHWLARDAVSATVMLVCLPLAWLIAVGVHEFGHITGGWLIGGRFLLWVAGPIKAVRTPHGIRWGWNRSVNPAGGMAACLPSDCRGLSATRLAIMILGGPVASLLLWGAIVSLVPRVTPGAGPLTSRLVPVISMTGSLSLLLFALTSLPFTAGGFKSDGRRAWDLTRPGPRRDQEMAMVILSMQILAGIRPRDLDPDLLRQSLQLQDGSAFDLYARLNAYAHAADSGDWDSARRHLETMVAGEDALVPLVAATIRCEYAWLVATVGTNPALARAWLQSAGPMDFDPATRLRAESAVLLAEGSRDLAHAKAIEGLRALDTRTLSPVRSPFAADALEGLVAASG